jgi:hypothetical protein
MRIDHTHGKPSLLMLSDCFPDPQGGHSAVRAWGLMRYAASTHRVYLAAVADRAVNLRHWRRVAGLVDRVHIEPRRSRLSPQSPIHGEAGVWAHQRRFDALLVTSPRVWPGASPGRIGLTLCDFTRDLDPEQTNAAAAVGLLGRLGWPGLRRGVWQAKKNQALEQCDRLLVGSESQADRLRDTRAPVEVIPDGGAAGAWAALFGQTRTPQPTAPDVTIFPVQPLPIRKAA